jgi:hypothetical protein
MDSSPLVLFIPSFIKTCEQLAWLCIRILSLENTLRESETQSFSHHSKSTEIRFHAKPSKKRIGCSPEAVSPRSNDRHFEGSGLSQDHISKLHAMITSVKGSQEIKMRSYLYLLVVMMQW